MRRYLLALITSAIVVGMAPFVGLIRDALRQAVSLKSFLAVMGIGFGLALGAFVILALFRIRHHRVLRYGGLSLGLGLMAMQLLVWNRGTPEVDAVERIHFVFYGLVAFLFYRAFRASRSNVWMLVLTFVAVAIVAVLDEWLQWLVPVRTGEVVDVVLNLYAGLCGVILSLSVAPPEGLGWRTDAATWIELRGLGVLFLLTFGGFLHCAHLGYQIDDPEIGLFRSYFTPDELAEHSAVRRAEWERGSDLHDVHPLSKEDYYRTEAGWHVSHRNRSLEIGDYYPAWKENRILEKYFDPFLDTLNKVGKPYRLPSPDLDRIQSHRPQPDPFRYSSPADSKRIFTSPRKLEMWCVIAILVGLCLLPLRRRT